MLQYYKLPDDAAFFSGFSFGFVGGTFEGIMPFGKSTVKKEIRKASKITAAINRFATKLTPYTKAVMCKALKEQYSISYLQQVIEGVSVPDSKTSDFYKEIKELALTSLDRNIVKYGLYLMTFGDITADKDMVLNLAKHEEFTVHAIKSVLLGLEEPNDIIFDIAKHVEGWGKISAVEYLSPDTDEIKGWPLRYGCTNNIMDNYLALICAENGQLLEALIEDTGPAGSIEDYNDGTIVVGLYLSHAGKHIQNNIDGLLTVCAINEMLSRPEFLNNGTMSKGWSKDLIDSYNQTCEQIIADQKWIEVIWNHVKTDDGVLNWKGREAARKLHIEGKADIIFAAEPSSEEIELAKNNGVELKLTPIGMDAFVFIVNNQNPVDGLTVEQIRQIYSGQITNWKDIDGVTDREIIAYQRPKNSGSQTLMENVVMKGLTMMDAPTDRRPGGMGGMMDVVADYKNAENSLGYTVYYYASQMNRKESVNFLAVGGVPCNKETIRTGIYPFAGALYAVTRHGDERESAQKFLNYLLTVDGQKLVEKGGFVSADAANVPEQTRIIRYPESEFGVTELVNYIKRELHADVIEFGHKIVDTNGDFIEDTVEADFVNGHVNILHISVTNEFDYDTDFVNRPVQLTFEIDDKQAVYQNPWNDGVQAYIFAFMCNDQYMNIVVTSSGTGTGDHHTTIYHYNGEKIFKFAEFSHYVGELYSAPGKVYFVQMQFENDGVTAPAVMSLDMESGKIDVVKDG